MIVDLRTISHSTRHFSFTLEPDWWNSGEEGAQVLGLDGPLNVYMTISKVDVKYVVDGRLNGGLKVRCDRCLEPFHRELKSEFRFFLAYPVTDEDETEVELLEDDMSIEFVTGDELNLYDIVREQIYLSFPITSLCREDCLGLCPVCGANMNIEKCKCQLIKGHPGFSKLNKLYQFSP